MLQYLLELRQSLLRYLGVLVILFSGCFYYSHYLLHYFLSPLAQVLPASSPLIVTQLIAPVWMTVEVTTYFALFLSAPYLLIELWCFFSPALYLAERRLLGSMLLLSLSMFVLGVACCFFIVLPWVFKFLVTYLPRDIHLMPDVVSAVAFILKMLWVFGIGFQIPIVCICLTKMEWVSLDQLILARRYVIVSAFIIGMFLAPPDVFSQTVLALPFWAVYELGILAARCVKISSVSSIETVK